MLRIKHFLNFIAAASKGLLLVGLIVTLSFYLSSIKSIHDSTHLAATAFAILIGALLSPWFFRFQHILQTGVQFSAKKLLRLGIILYGFNITFSELYNIGFYGFLAAFIVIIVIFLIAIFAGIKIFKLDKETSMLVGAGSAICGAAAVLALESSLKSDSFKGVVAVGSVVIFGLIAMFLYPIAFSTGIIPTLDSNGMGLFMGATLHEVANVAGAAEMAKEMTNGAFTQSAANLAVIIKMMRVILLVPFLLIVAYFIAKKNAAQSTPQKMSKKIDIPYFAFLFLGVIVLNTLLNAHKNTLILSTLSVQDLIEIGQFLCALCIVFAMAALGLQIDFKKFFKLGGKAFGLAFVLFIILIFGGYLLTLCFQGILW